MRFLTGDKAGKSHIKSDSFRAASLYFASIPRCRYGSRQSGRLREGLRFPLYSLGSVCNLPGRERKRLVRVSLTVMAEQTDKDEHGSAGRKTERSVSRRFSPFVWLILHSPSVFRARLARLLFAAWKKAWPSQRTPFKGFSPTRKEGVNLAAHICGETGLGQAARGIAEALEASRLPFNVINFAADSYAPQSDSSWLHKETRHPEYDVSVLVINPDDMGNARLRLPKALFSDRYVIGYWFWELPEIPDNWLPAFSLVDEVWAASRFIQESLSKKSPVPVTRIPAVVNLHNDGTLSRQLLNLPQDRFLFLSMGDASSVMARKNPMAAVRAFQKAFNKSDSRVGLVLKIRERNPFRRDMSSLRREIAGWPNIYLLEQSMSRQEINSLIAVTDCFVSLHRSEGFGLVPAEAMSLGKPVIMTEWSGNTDYMTPDNSIGIKYELVKLQRDYGPYKAGQVWAEPDVEQAADWMTKFAGDHDLAHAVGQRGRQTIQEDLSPRVVGDLIQKRLAEIRKQYR